VDWFAGTRPLIIAHRGASADAPENTLYAFALAMEQGADGFEFDVQLSADGQLVVMHDFTVDRMTNGSGSVSKLSLAELQALELPHKQTIPTLDEVFEAFGPQPLYNVEIKTMGIRETGLETAVADRIQAHHLEDRVLVSSFNPISVRRSRRYLTSRTPVANIRYRGLLNYGYLIAPSQADHPHYPLVNEKYMTWAKKHGYKINVWTVDDPDEARRLVTLGVHGIITNKPQLIRDSLS
jgi:glycerophosphoryl diester phosphodiesterase